MANAVQSVIEDWTGVRVEGCPWRAFNDPFVLRVLKTCSFFESGQMEWASPLPSNRLVEGVEFYQNADRTVQAKVLEEEAKAD